MFDSRYLNEALEVVPQKYLLAKLVTMRMRQLIDGADPLVDAEGLEHIDTALKEISEGMIAPHKEEIPTGEDLFA